MDKHEQAPYKAGLSDLGPHHSGACNIRTLHFQTSYCSLVPMRRGNEASDTDTVNAMQTVQWRAHSVAKMHHARMPCINVITVLQDALLNVITVSVYVTLNQCMIQLVLIQMLVFG